ncbi:MAG: carbon-nitrogen hydrolase family protein [Ectothiorhodospiraceae bacterium]
MTRSDSERARVAAVQMASGPQVAANLYEADRLVGMAAAAGARLVVLPENVAIMGRAETDKLAHVEADGDGPIQQALSRSAARHGVWLVGGTIPLAGREPERARAACVVYDDTGARVARYDKIHLFDVQVSGEPAYQESATLEPGDSVVTVSTPCGRLGLSVCYDLRFPELYRVMMAQGAEIFAVPSAFTARTGAVHWRPLLQARAIENLCSVVAAGQGGYHVNGRETHGDSLVLDPWGNVQDALARGSGIVVGEVDPERTAELRQRFPALDHRRLDCPGSVHPVGALAGGH